MSRKEIMQMHIALRISMQKQLELVNKLALTYSQCEKEIPLDLRLIQKTLVMWNEILFNETNLTQLTDKMLNNRIKECINFVDVITEQLSLLSDKEFPNE